MMGVRFEAFQPGTYIPSGLSREVTLATPRGTNAENSVEVISGDVSGRAALWMKFEGSGNLDLGHDSRPVRMQSSVRISGQALDRVFDELRRMPRYRHAFKQQDDV